MKPFLFSFTSLLLAFLLVAAPIQAQVVHGHEDSSLTTALWSSAILAAIVILFVANRWFRSFKVSRQEKPAAPNRTVMPAEIRRSVDERLDTEVTLIRAHRPRRSVPSVEPSLKIPGFNEGSLARIAAERSLDNPTESTSNIFFLDLPEQARRWDLGQFWENVFNCQVDMLTFGCPAREFH